MENVMRNNRQSISIASASSNHQDAAAHPRFWQAARFWAKLGFISFGGPAGQIAIMHRELVDQKKWISNARFLNALNYCMLLPGPEAQQLATYIGWLLHRLPGGIAAGALFVIPSVFILFGLSYIYVAYGALPWVVAIFDGLKAAIMAIVVAAVIKIGKKALKNSIMAGIAILAFIAIFMLKIPFPFIVLGAGGIGLAGSFLFPERFDAAKGTHADEFDAGYVQICDDEASCHINPSSRRTIAILVVFGLLWLVPVAGLAFLPAHRVFYTEALFFTKAAFLTFGGAYAVLAYIAQAGVAQYGWLEGSQMIDGLGLAETTPGPLIMVVQFVGFMAGWNHASGLSPIAGALVGSLVATYFTFLPCFLFIFLGGPYIEKLRNNVRLAAVLSSITAAVVGVVLNLAVWFGLQVLFPDNAPFNGFALVVGLAAFTALQWLNVSMLGVIAISGAAGLIWHYALL